MSDALKKEDSSANALLVIVGIIVGVFASVAFWFVLFSSAAIIGGLLQADAIFYFMLLILPFVAMLAAMYYTLSQKPTGIVLGGMIGGALGFLLQGLCAVAFWDLMVGGK